jgi:site-specific DNA recombinase
MPVKDIKKAGPGSPRGNDIGECVSQPALFEEEATGQEEAAPVGPARVGGGRAAVYARVSSEQQEKDQTIESQMAAIAAYAQEHDVKLMDEGVYTDEGYSGHVLRRPALDKLLDAVYEGRYQRVLIMNPFRLARNYGHQILLMEEFQRGDCQVVFIQRPIGQGPDEDLLLQMQGVIAQYEHAKIQERTRRGKLHRMRQGELVNGQRVYGYEYVKRKGEIPAHFEIIETEAEVVRKIYHWYVYDGLALRAIAMRLRDAAIPTVRGGRWSGANIGRVMRNSLYIGTGYGHKIEAVEPKDRRRGYRKDLKSSQRKRPKEEWIPFSAPKIVDDEIFELAQQRFQRNRDLAARRTKRNYLLRGLLTCECCQKAMFAETQSKSYMCGYSRRAHAEDSGVSPCENKRRLPVGQLDELIWREVVKLLKKPAMLKKHYPNLREKIHPRATGGSPDKLDAKIGEVEKQIKRANNLFIRGMLDQASHTAKYSELTDKLRHLQAQREKAAADSMDQKEAAELLRSFTSFAKTIQSRLNTADFATRRNIVEQVVKRVIIGKSVITIEHIAPCERYQLRNNLERW